MAILVPQVGELEHAIKKKTSKFTAKRTTSKIPETLQTNWYHFLYGKSLKNVTCVQMLLVS